MQEEHHILRELWADNAADRAYWRGTAFSAQAFADQALQTGPRDLPEPIMRRPSSTTPSATSTRVDSDGLSDGDHDDASYSPNANSTDDDEPSSGEDAAAGHLLHIVPHRPAGIARINYVAEAIVSRDLRGVCRGLITLQRVPRDQRDKFRGILNPSRYDVDCYEFANEPRYRPQDAKFTPDVKVSTDALNRMMSAAQQMVTGDAIYAGLIALLDHWIPGHASPDVRASVIGALGVSRVVEHPCTRVAFSSTQVVSFYTEKGDAVGAYKNLRAQRYWEKPIWLIPLHECNGPISHFTVAVVQPRHRRIEIFDSLGSTKITALAQAKVRMPLASIVHLADT